MSLTITPSPIPRLRGRPSRYAQFERLLAELPRTMEKRPLYRDQIGLFRGARGKVTVYVKVRLPGGGAKEIKLGNLTSWPWDKLIQKRDDLQGRADRGEALETAPLVTFSTYSTEWLQRKRFTVKAHGILKGHVEKHLRPTFGGKELGAITVSDVNRWISAQRETLKPATVQRQLATFNAILNDAVRAGALAKNPTKQAEPVRGAEGRSRFLGQAEQGAVLAAAERIEAVEVEEAEQKPQQKRGWLRFFILWALCSGMRRQEILNMRWSDLIEAEGTVSILIPTSKSGKPRIIGCTPDMRRMLTQLRNLPWTDGERIFPVSLTTLKRKLGELWKETGLSDVRLHDLRRTHASTLIRNGVDLRTVAGRLGHRDLAMLERHYAPYLGDAHATEAAQQAFSKLFPYTDQLSCSPLHVSPPEEPAAA